MRSTLSPPSRIGTPINPNFRTTVESLKNRTSTKDIEDEYIRGLQDEIKYMEYELKLLKDKELQQQSTVEHLGKVGCAIDAVLRRRGASKRKHTRNEESLYESEAVV